MAQTTTQSQIKKDMKASNGHSQNGNGAIVVKVAYIDDQPFEMKDGETILSFVRRNKDKKLIPTLCDAPNLEPFGSCRVCSVDVALVQNGPVKTQASCHTPVLANSYIYTSSERVQRLRRNIIELVLTDHPLDCLTCEVNNNCELQEVAARVGVRDVRYPEGKKSSRSNQRFESSVYDERFK